MSDDDFLDSLLAEVEELQDDRKTDLPASQNADLRAEQAPYVPTAHFVRPRRVEEPWCVLHVYSSTKPVKRRVVHMIVRGLEYDDAVEFALCEVMKKPRHEQKLEILTVVTEKALRESGVPLPKRGTL